MPWPSDLELSVLHGVGVDDMAAALKSPARPVLNSAAQVARWRETGGRPCDVMVDTGMNRLGLRPHRGRRRLARRARDRHADEPPRLRRRGQPATTSAQRERVRGGRRCGPRTAPQPRQQRRHLPRPRLCLRPDPARPRPLWRRARGARRTGISARSSVSRRRSSSAGGSRPASAVGYGAHLHARSGRASSPSSTSAMPTAICAAFRARGRARLGDRFLPVAGRVSMDLTAIRVDEAPHLAEGDWVEIDYELPAAAGQSGLSQYELLTGLGAVRAALDLAQHLIFADPVLARGPALGAFRSSAS